MDPDKHIRAGSIILYSGICLSTIGYLLMLTTAAAFQAWRRSAVNRGWLYMCGAQLVWAYVDSIYYLWFYRCIAVPWLEGHIGFALHIFLGNYFFLASCGWMVSGAWLAHRNLVSVMEDSDSKYMIKASLFSWITPIPTSISAAVVATDAMKWENCIMIFVAKGHIHIWLTILCSVCLYARVLHAVWRNAKDNGRRVYRRGTTLLAFMFALTSGVQYVVLFIYKYVSDSEVNKNVLLQVKFFIISYNVSIYSIMFIVGIKQTRKLWSQSLGKVRQGFIYDV